MTEDFISISIVSHNQAFIAKRIIEDISAIGQALSAEILLTINIDEHLPFKANGYEHPVKIIKNSTAKGFGSNHNAAFQQSRGQYFCVLNPDIRLFGNPFQALIDCLKISGDGVAAPTIVNPKGRIENSARRFPTPFSIFKKALSKSEETDYPQTDEVFEPDWVGGMFMLFTRRCFEVLKGFDERYFLYYEDVDLCARMKMAHLPVLLCPEAKAVHDARFDSHRNPKYMVWHLRSMLRFFASRGFWQLAAMKHLRG